MPPSSKATSAHGIENKLHPKRMVKQQKIKVTTASQSSLNQLACYCALKAILTAIRDGSVRLWVNPSFRPAATKVEMQGPTWRYTGSFCARESSPERGERGEERKPTESERTAKPCTSGSGQRWTPRRNCQQQQQQPERQLEWGRRITITLVTRIPQTILFADARPVAFFRSHDNYCGSADAQLLWPT